MYFCFACQWFCINHIVENLTDLSNKPPLNKLEDDETPSPKLHACRPTSTSVPTTWYFCIKFVPFKSYYFDGKTRLVSCGNEENPSRLNLFPCCPPNRGLHCRNGAQPCQTSLSLLAWFISQKSRLPSPLIFTIYCLNPKTTYFA